jgi:tetratricopeptide (TPR) repeat protein
MVLSCYHFAVAQSAELIDSLETVSRVALEPSKKIEALLKLSAIMEGSDQNKALEVALKAFDFAESSNLPDLKVRSLIRIGACYITLNNYILALKYTEEARELAKKYNLTKDIAFSLGNLSIIYAELGDYEKSSSYSFQALKLYEQMNERESVGIVLGNIGTDFLTIGNYTKAFDYLYKSLKIAEELNDKSGIAYQYNNIGGAYFKEGNNLEKALYYFNKALVINKELGNKSLQILNYLNIGSVYFAQNTNDSALHYFQLALTANQGLNRPYSLAGCQLQLGTYYAKTNNFDEAFRYSKSALEIGVELNSFETILDAAAVLHNLFISKRDSANAYKYAIIEYQAKDTLHQRQNKKDLLRVEFQYNSEKFERLREVQQQKRNYIVGLIILALLSVIAIVILINSRQRVKVKNTLLEKKAIESELEFKNKELSINLMALMKKNEMLSEISDKLIEIEKKAIKEDTKSAIIQICQDIRRSNDDKIWKEFSSQFQEIHSGFYEALLKRFPDLTQSDLKLCAFLRLNMSTKDIVELTGQSKLTIENARYRIRRKLGISNSDTNLVTFLLQV